MTIIAVDDERRALRMLADAIREALPNAELATFSTSAEALDYAENHRVDIAFLDVRMPEMDGLALAKALKNIFGKTNIVFVTGYSEYALDAFSLHASGYLQKPVDAEQILREMGNLRNPVRPENSGTHIRCFGNFGVLVDGKPLLFTRAKAKELLALLVHKQGTALSNAEIAALLWEDKPYDNSLQTQIRQTRAQLIQILTEAGIGDILRRARNSLAVDTSKFSCDYYDYLQGRLSGVNAYTGEYLSEYSWAEFTTGYLDRKTR